MDLSDCLKLVFPNKLTDKYEKMIEELKCMGIDCEKDFKYFDEEASTKLKNFTPIEAKKLIDWIQNPGLVLLVKVLPHPCSHVV